MRILLVTEIKNFFVSSLEKQLIDQGHMVVQTGAGISQLEKLDIEQQIVLIYAEDVASKKKGLVYLKDKAAELEMPILAIGDAHQLKELEVIIPRMLIKKEYLYPVGVKEILDGVEKCFQAELEKPKKKILVVDDSGAVLRSVKNWLEKKYQVILANSGAMAIKYLALNHPDLVLLDYEMPICDGKQVLEMIRSERDFADVPVIFLTSKGDRESVMSVSELKPEGYLLKTLEPEKIIQAVDNFFVKK
ncbi:MAG: response regulator [Lachnospiraceae bacterium]|nr:response regulator [Lachnospiraceae bacterium]